MFARSRYKAGQWLGAMAHRDMGYTKQKNYCQVPYHSVLGGVWQLLSFSPSLRYLEAYPSLTLLFDVCYLVLCVYGRVGWVYVGQLDRIMWFAHGPAWYDLGWGRPIIINITSHPINIINLSSSALDPSFIIIRKINKHTSSHHHYHRITSQISYYRHPIVTDVASSLSLSSCLCHCHRHSGIRLGA